MPTDTPPYEEEFSMSMKLSTPLQQFFQSELQEDANATLISAQTHLRELYEGGPDEPGVGSCVALLAEIDELHGEYDSLKPLSEIVAPPGATPQR